MPERGRLSGQAIKPDSTGEELPCLDHLQPDDKAPHSPVCHGERAGPVCQEILIYWGKVAGPEPEVTTPSLLL